MPQKSTATATAIMALDKVVEVLKQNSTRHETKFYQKVACPLFRSLSKAETMALIQSGLGTGGWKQVKLECGETICHHNEDDVSRKVRGPFVCIVLDGLVGIQALSRVPRFDSGPETRSETVLSAIATPGELVREFGLASELGKCAHKGDDLALSFALTDCELLLVPHDAFGTDKLIELAEKANVRGGVVMRAFLSGLLGSLYDRISTNRVIERRLAGASDRTRFAVTALAVCSRLGSVDRSGSESPEDWWIVTDFSAKNDFFKGLARYRLTGVNWRNSLSDRTSPVGKSNCPLCVPDGSKGPLAVQPLKLVPPSIVRLFESQLTGLQNEDDFRRIARDMAYSAYRLTDRPTTLAGLSGLPSDCLRLWDEHLKIVLPHGCNDASHS